MHGRATISRQQLAEIEAAAVRSWPALETADLDGWLWRYASGGSQRANSVATLSFAGTSVERAICEAEVRYRAKGAVCRFTIAGVTAPGDLDQRLAALGYERGQDHLTMLREVRATATIPASVELIQDATPEWIEVYLCGLNDDRKVVAPSILAGLPARRTFFAYRRQGRIVSSGLSIVDGQLASVQCMATLPEARRQGGALAILSAIEARALHDGCTHLYLQAEVANAAALALYAGFGFRVAGRYHLRTKP